MTAIARIERALDRIETMLALAEAIGELAARGWRYVLDDGDCLDPEFVDHCVASAADMALLFAGASQDRMLRELHTVRERMTAKLAEAFGTEIAALTAESFVATVVRRKAEIEFAVGDNLGAIQ